MTLLSETLASEAYLSERFAWLMGSGASCLPFDHIGRRVSQTCWGKRQPFKNWIAARVRAENWAKRRVLVLLRGCGALVFDDVLRRVVDLAEFGVFQQIVQFL